MKIVFFGTPDYVVPVLEILHREFKAHGESPISAVVTGEPKLVGRNQLKTFSPVDEWAYGHKKPKFFKPADIIANNILSDIGVLASYGKIVPESVIKYFKYGIINIHPSLLPNWRGSSPIQASIISGNTLTGVTFMKLDPLLDHGPIISQFKEEILPTDNSLSLRTRLFNRAADAIPSLLEAYVSGKTKSKSQDHDKATFTKELKKEDGFIPPEILSSTLKGGTLQGELEIPWMKVEGKSYSLQPTAYNLFNFIRAMQPWPGAWTHVKILGYKDTKILRLKLNKAHLANLKPEHQQLILDEVQLEGKSPVPWKQFCEGYPEAVFSK